MPVPPLAFRSIPLPPHRATAEHAARSLDRYERVSAWPAWLPVILTSYSAS
jgi:hypothetical protein